MDKAVPAAPEINRGSIASYLVPRFRDILFLIVFAVAMAAGWRTLNSDGDLPRHLLMGQVIVETRSIPRQEIFSYVYEGRPYVVNEWLADVLYYLTYQALGLKGVVLLTAVLMAFAFYVLYASLCSEFDERLLLLILVLWGALNVYQHLIARPHLFSVFFLAIWLVVADRIRRGLPTKFWILPGLMLLWSNLHPEFISGFLVLIAYLAGWTWDYAFHPQTRDTAVLRNLGVALVLSFAASLINPFGLQAWSSTVNYVGNTGLMSAINDTRAPDFSSVSYLAEFTLILASLLILALKKGSLPGGHAFLLAGFTALAMTSGRNIHLYGVVAPFALAGPLIEMTDSAFQKKIASGILQIERQLKGFVWPVATVVTFSVLLVLGFIGKEYIIDPGLFPVAAVQWLERNPPSGHMFNDFKWGGYLVWQLWPAQKDFIDGKSDLTGEATRAYDRVESRSPGWQATLNQYDVQWAILSVDSALGQELAGDGWSILYKDGTAIVLRRGPGPE